MGNEQFSGLGTLLFIVPRVLHHWAGWDCMGVGVVGTGPLLLVTADGVCPTAPLAWTSSPNHCQHLFLTSGCRWQGHGATVYISVRPPVKTQTGLLLMWLMWLMCFFLLKPYGMDQWVSWYLFASEFIVWNDKDRFSLVYWVFKFAQQTCETQAQVWCAALVYEIDFTCLIMPYSSLCTKHRVSREIDSLLLSTRRGSALEWNKCVCFCAMSQNDKMMCPFSP